MTSPGIDVPAGSYVTTIGNIRAKAGGQTRVLLMRHRLFAQHLGIEVPILTYSPSPGYDPVRAALHDERQLLPGSRLVNMHEELRAGSTRPPEGFTPSTAAWEADPLEHGLRPGRLTDDEHGRPWRRELVDDSGQCRRWQLLRPDGSLYVEMSSRTRDTPTTLHDEDGAVVGSWASLGSLWRWWTEAWTAADGSSDRVFVLSDSRYLSEELAGIRDPRFHVMHQVHNPHTLRPRRWSSPIVPTYRRLMDRIGELDGMSLLTERQRDDVERRYGATDNLVVIGNPVDPPLVPEPRPERQAGRVVIIARLHPDARLDVYGDGPERAAIEALVADSGVSDRVRLHGFRADAVDELWSADLMWVTSDFEGYSLAILEARARGCPVAALDVRYGPREQIVDGVDGLLVDPRDLAGLARRSAELLADRPRLDRMRDAVVGGSAGQSHEVFLRGWAEALHGAVDRKEHRVRLTDVRLQAEPTAAPGQAPPRRRAAGPGPLAVRAVVDVDHVGGDPAEAHWAVQAWSPSSEALVELALEVQREGSRWSLSAETDVTALAALGAGRHEVAVRALLTWRNAGWQAPLLEQLVVDVVDGEATLRSPDEDGTDGPAADRADDRPGAGRRLARRLRRGLRGLRD